MVERLDNQVATGDGPPAERLLPQVYGQLRALAEIYLKRERNSHTLQPTALVHEAYLKLSAGNQAFKDRTHYLSVAARAMRQVLVDHARRHTAAKRGGTHLKIALDETLAICQGSEVDFSHISEALDRLAALDDRKRQVVELRFFGGMTNAEVAQCSEVSLSTVEADWRVARAWMRRELSTVEAP